MQSVPNVHLKKTQVPHFNSFVLGQHGRYRTNYVIEIAGIYQATALFKAQ
jgi:hypothetical protein